MSSKKHPWQSFGWSMATFKSQLRGRVLLCRFKLPSLSLFGAFLPISVHVTDFNEGKRNRDRGSKKNIRKVCNLGFCGLGQVLDIPGKVEVWLGLGISSSHRVMTNK